MRPKQFARQGCWVLTGLLCVAGSDATVAFTKTSTSLCNSPLSAFPCGARERGYPLCTEICLEGIVADFSQPGKSQWNPRKQRVRRRELVSSLTQGRVSMPTPGARSIRMEFHNVPLSLPPPPGAPSQHLSEHSYWHYVITFNHQMNDIVIMLI